MEVASPRWQEITPSEFPWEREALEFVRGRLPDHEPYRAWANFEFVADDGSINEVDLLVLGPKGFFLVEIKSQPGIVEGDAGTWVWHHEGRTAIVDNPLLLANRKAKKLIGLLRRQAAMRKVRSPFLEAHVFLSHEEVRSQLPDYLQPRVHLRDATTEDGRERAGIIAALTRWRPDAPPRMRVDKPIAKAIARAIDEAGIRRSQRARRVGDYQLDELLLDGPTYQDWTARHVSLESDTARVRIYGVAPSASKEDREAIDRAARREYEILKGIVHEGILPARSYTRHVTGPALIFEHRPGSQRLDHYLATRGAQLDVDQRLGILRQLAEAVAYAHEKRLVHRALSPQSVLVLDPRAEAPRIQVYNWHAGLREAATGRTTAVGTSGTSHLEELVEDAAQVYMAPEALDPTLPAREEADVFSLGAIAYHLFAGQPPASGIGDLKEKLREGFGLQISSVLDGAWVELQQLVQEATCPEVSDRSSMADFLVGLDLLEEAITAPATDDGIFGNPAEAGPGDRLEHGFTVKRRLGKGSTSVALLVERDGVERVLKVALTPEHNERLRDEGEVLAQLRHQSIVELHETLELGDRVALVLAKAGDTTLGDRLREEGHLHLDLLERFGEDLLQAVAWLEERGIPHRDIKPENLGVTEMGRQGKKHLVLFDFSLSRTSSENIRAGTRPYLDPFLHLRRPARWDLAAERFAAAMTLHQMATGTLPQWGDGQSDPGSLDCEVTLEADAFEPSVREPMVAFFARALRRDAADRFHNAEEMLRTWRHIFLSASRPETSTDHGEAEALTRVEEATLETRLSELGLSARALSAVERMNVRTVAELLRFPLVQLHRMRGVGNRTRRELSELARRLADCFPAAARQPKEPLPAVTEVPDEAIRVSVDELVRQILPAARGPGNERDAAILRVFLGLATDDDHRAGPWPTQSEVARALDVSRAPVSQALARARRRWRKNPGLTQLRNEVVELLEAQSGAVTAREAADAILARRGSVQEEPLRTRHAIAVLRAADEAERDLAAPRWTVRRPTGIATVLLARDELDDQGVSRIDGQKLADYVERLGRRADALATTEPLPTPARVLETLQAVPTPEDVPRPAAGRLLQLAVAAARRAALSSRLELYPRGMAASRALKLALGALAGARELGIRELRQRVEGRYPEAERLPGRPELDRLLSEVGSDLCWQPPTAGAGRGAYMARWRSLATVPSSTTTTLAAETDTYDADAFERRLERALEEQAFLALAVPAHRALEVERALAVRFPVDVRSFDELLIRHLKKVVVEARADWGVVLRADAAPRESNDWATLVRTVAKRALPRVRDELAEAPRPVLLTNLGLLARYDQMSFLDELRDGAGRPGGAPGLWLLAAGDRQAGRPVVDGRPVPVFTPAQWALVPEAWIARIRARSRPGAAKSPAPEPRGRPTQ